MPSKLEPSGKRDPAPAARDRLVRCATLLPTALLIASMIGLACFFRALLAEAASGGAPAVGGFGYWIAVGGFFAIAGAVVVMQALRITARVAGPEYRLRAALQRIRTGDVGFRVALRRGDLLTGLAHECNDLLDWLNANPPAGVRTGSDIVEAVETAEEPAEQAS